MADIKGLKKAQLGSGQSSTAGTGDENSQQAVVRINRELEEKNVMETAKEKNIPYVEIAVFPINPDILHLMPEGQARSALVLPFFKAGENLKVAAVDPEDPAAKEALKALEEKGFTVQINLVSKSGLISAMRHYASDQYKLKTEIKNVVGEEEIHYEKELENLAKLKDQIGELPAEEALNLLNVSAIRAGASDMHFQPEQAICLVRFRIDGVLHNAFEMEKSVYEKIAGQLKYKTKMKLNITSVPQDGRFRFIVNERSIDVRVASLPTEYGEAFVCRILDSGRKFNSFEELGFSGRSLEILNKASDLSKGGMILVTGPTSSGKTTTLYVLLNRFNKPEIKIITLEDPIEYHLAGISQSQMDEKKGYNFASGLRSILRQDPDIVMVGEIRDLETAEVCSQAALTGHVLLSTLHSNSAVDAIPRLTTLGLPPFVMAPALSIVIAQRLVRRLCDKCSVEKSPSAAEKDLVEKTLQGIKVVEPSLAIQMPEKLKKAKGCEECNFTGYRGQIVISEVLSIDDEIKDAILKSRPTKEIFELGRKKGMLTMMEDAIQKVILGQTTLQEIHRVINA